MTGRRVLTVLVATIELFGFVRQASAVPIPFKNCGSPTDIVRVTNLQASMWPPVGTPAPIEAIPVYDVSTGGLSSLTIHLLLGFDWVFQTGNLAAPLVGGFVALPSSIPMTLVSPTLPIGAGPVSTTETFVSSNPGSQPVTIASGATIGQSIPSVNATLALSLGTPGFPVPQTAGTYTATVQATESSGQRIFCVTFSLFNVSFVATPATSTALSSSINPSFFGQTVTFTATVTSASGTPAGDVSFNEGATLLGTAAVDASGRSTFTTSLPPGTHDLTATFNGSGGFAGSTSTSPVLVQTAIIPTPTLDGRALLMLAMALACIGALMLRRS